MISGVGVVAAAVAVAGCGGGARHGVAGVRAAVAPRCAVGEIRTVGSRRVAWAGVVRRPVTAYREPGRGALAHFGVRNANGVPTVLGVVGERVTAACRVAWLRVELPVRPNGSAGWVRARDLVRVRVRTRIAVDLSARRVRLFRAGRLVLGARAAVGSRATPTPVGRFYVTQRLRPSDPSGPYGPGAVGISAFSPVLTGWAQGGPIAIHGTNEPWSVGRAVSNGCIRLRNADLRRVFRLALPGTPVVIAR